MFGRCFIYDLDRCWACFGDDSEGGIFDPTVYRGGLQTKFISSLDIAYIKFRPKNDKAEAQHLFLIICCILFSTSKKTADPNSKKINKNDQT